MPNGAACEKPGWSFKAEQRFRCTDGGQKSAGFTKDALNVETRRNGGTRCIYNWMNIHKLKLTEQLRVLNV